MSKYEVIIYWSADDKAFIAEVPELPGCAADGATKQAALKNVDVVIKEWIATAKEHRLGLILALMKWQPDAIWGLATNQMANHGHFTRVGYTILERGFLRWQWSTDSIGPMEYLVASEKHSLENLVEEMVSPEQDIALPIVGPTAEHVTTN